MESVKHWLSLSPPPPKVKYVKKEEAFHLLEVCEVDVDDLLIVLSSIFSSGLVHCAAVYIYTSWHIVLF